MKQQINLKHLLLTVLFFSLSGFCFASPFNAKLTSDERSRLEKGELLIKNINFKKNICLNKSEGNLSKELLTQIEALNPKYLAEVIQFKPYKGNEDLPQRLETTLNNVSDYAGIPYFSERTQSWYDLYESADIKSVTEKGDKTVIKAELVMEPFDIVKETIDISKKQNEVLYVAKNDNTLRYLDKFDCIYPERMKICIYLFRDGDNWILYGIGGVNAPRIPFFTERIQTSFINRINTFCSFIFNKF